MLLSYFKVILRQFRNVFSLINLSGLTVGFIAFILIYLWIYEELLYDHFHLQQERIYRVITNQETQTGTPYFIALTPDPLGPYLKETFGEVEQACRLVEVEFLIRHKEQAFFQNGLAADASFFELFSFPVAEKTGTWFEGADQIIITEKLGRSYFGNADPLGKIFTVVNRDLQVVGVMKDIPAQSHLKFDYIIPFAFLEKAGLQKPDQWGYNRYHTYVLLKEKATALFLDKIKDVIQQHVPHSSITLSLQSLRDIHLHSGVINNDMAGRGSAQYVMIFSAVGVFILIIASINYANLATARSMKRAKEAGVRKVVGASRWQLMMHFFSESLIYTLLAFAMALICAWLLLPTFNEITGKHLAFDIISSGALTPLLMAVVFCAFLGGAYPALLLSALNPAQVLRGQVVSSKSALFIRRGLVIFQFFLSISLLTTTLIVHEQLEYIQSRQLGFEKENVITFSANRKLRQVYPAFKNELLTLPGVAGVTASSSKLSFFDQSTSNVQWEGKDPDLHLIFHQLMVDPDFLDVFHIGLSAGRGFDKNIASDSTAIVLNNEAVKQMGLADPLYKKLIINDTHEGMVIGVVNDFNFKSAHKNIEPVVIYIDPSSYYEVSVRLVPGKLQEQVTSVEAIFKKFNPDWPFEYSFLDSDIENLYRTEQRISRIFNHLSRLSIFVSCLGLLGMVIFVADQRAKEVALRKVMGASSWHLTWLLSAEFIYLVLIAFLISTPIIYLGSSVWLNTFAYRITPGAKLFLTSGGISLAVAWAIVGYKSFRSGMANPIDTLRSE